MSIDGFEGKVLIVDDHALMRGLFTRFAEQASVDFVVLEDAESAVASIDASVGAVVSDGLNGGWKQVIAAAQEARIPGAVVSNNPDIQGDVEAAGALFIDKAKMGPGFMETTLEQLIPKPKPEVKAAETSAEPGYALPVVSQETIQSLLKEIYTDGSDAVVRRAAAQLEVNNPELYAAYLEILRQAGVQGHDTGVVAHKTLSLMHELLRRADANRPSGQ